MQARLILGLLVGLSVLTPDDARADVPRWFSVDESSSERIVGGTIVSSCAWPTTVSMGGICTGTLVHPRVVIYAAHCGDTISQVRLGETSSGGAGRSLATQVCEVNPDYPSKPGSDHAFCVLSDSDEQNDVPIVPVLMGCETDLLAPGAEVTIVGFGQDDNQQSGTKREVTTFVNQVSNEISIGGAGKDSCYGDSGGPVYIKHPDGTWKVFGITSYGITQDCGPGGWYSMMHLGMPWIEGRLLSQHAIDITPCHDSAGTWEPGPDCAGFPQDAGTGYGSWDVGCGGGPSGGFSKTCGPGFDDLEPDETPPAVAITMPTHEQRFDGTVPVQLTVEAAADDGDGLGVESVSLVVNGAEVEGSAVTLPPYQWTIGLGDGLHALAATAVDKVGNTATSAPITIGINQDAVVPDDDGDTGGGGDPGAKDDDKGCGCTLSGTESSGLGLGFLSFLFATRRRRVRD